MADDDRSRCRVVLEPSGVTRLKGRGDAALPVASASYSCRARPSKNLLAPAVKILRSTYGHRGDLQRGLVRSDLGLA